MVGTLKARVGTSWVPIVGSAHDEVWTGNAPPDPAGIFELWVDTSTLPPTLKYKDPIGNWLPITSATPEPPLDEVWVDTVSPDPAGQFQLWVDQNEVPPVLKYKNATGDWVPVISPAAPTAYGGVTPATAFGQPPADGTAASLSRSDHFHGVLNETSEVAVEPLDPYTTDANSKAELWYDTTRNTLYAREGVAWVPVQTPVVLPKDAEEVFVGTEDPYVTDANAVVDLWFNSAANVRALFVRVGNAWVPASAGYGSVFPQLSFGMSSSPGVSEEASRADHSHGTPPEPPAATFGTLATDVTPGVNGAPGTQDAASRTDHIHAMKPYAPVTPEITFGSLPRDGTGDTFARGDHAHGVPPHPLPANGLVNQVLTKSSLTDYDAKWEFVAPTAAQVSEVEITPDDPSTANPQVELWYDTDDPGTSTHEVVVQTTEPTATDHPNADLWYHPGTSQMWVKVNNLWQPYVTRGNVTPQLLPDLPSSNGASSAFSRADHTHGTPPGNAADEVVVSPDVPPTPETELWFDTDAVSTSYGEVEVGPTDPYDLDPTTSTEIWYNTTIGQLMIRTGDEWLPAIPIAPNEVFVGTDPPPTPDVELWLDTDEAPPASGNVPPGGVTGAPLRKLSDVDLDVGWTGPAVLDAGVTVNGSGVTIGGTNQGVRFPGGARIYDWTDKALRLCEGPNGSQPQIANNDGGGARDIVDTINGDARYALTAHTHTTDHTHPAGVTHNITWLSGFSGSASVRVNDFMVTITMNNVATAANTLEPARLKLFDLPSGVPSPHALLRQAVNQVDANGTAWWDTMQIEVSGTEVHLQVFDNRGMTTAERFSGYITYAR